MKILAKDGGPLFRGPWADYWREYLPDGNKFITLTHGRVVVGVHEGQGL